MADPVSAGVATGAGEIIGGGMGMVGQGMANQREGRLSATQARNLNELINDQILNFDTRGLENAASRTLTKGQSALDASLASRGIFNSGAALSAQSGLASDVFSNLASQINQDQAARAGMAGEILSNPSFGFFDTDQNRAVNQGK